MGAAPRRGGGGVALSEVPLRTSSRIAVLPEVDLSISDIYKAKNPWSFMHWRQPGWASNADPPHSMEEDAGLGVKEYESLTAYVTSAVSPHH